MREYYQHSRSVRNFVTVEILLTFASHNPMLSVAFVGLTLAIIVTEVARLFQGYRGLSPSELIALINVEHAVVVDVSSAMDFEKGHIAGSRSLPVQSIDPQQSYWTSKKASPVALVCRNGNASAAVAKRLVKAGFQRVYCLDGGISAWQLAELPLLKGRG